MVFIGLDDDQAIGDRFEVANGVDEVAFAIHHDDGCRPFQIVQEERMEQGCFASARRRDDPMSGEALLVGEVEGNARFEEDRREARVSQVGLDRFARGAFEVGGRDRALAVGALFQALRVSNRVFASGSRTGTGPWFPACRNG